MALRLRITSQQKNQLGEARLREFVACGGTIGRAEDNDWVLPDDKRFISSRHALIDFQGGAYYLVDMSRNGVYVNGADTAVGRGHPQRLFDGDKLRLGEYDVSVEITAGDENVADDGMRDSVVRAQLVPVDDAADLKLVDEKTMRGFDYNALERQLQPEAATAPEPPKRKPAARQAATVASPAKRPAAQQASTAPPARPTASPATGSSAVDIFCSAAGLQPTDLRGSSPEEVLKSAGALTRELLTGLSALLQHRGRLKESLRRAQSATRPARGAQQASGMTAADAMRQLLGEYGHSNLPPDRAARAAFQHLDAHQQALLKAMIHAMRDFAERLEPEELRNHFDRGLKRSALLAGANKLKYWDLYEETYLTLTHQESGAPLPTLLLDELTRTYEQELDSLQYGSTRPLEARPAKAS